MKAKRLIWFFYEFYLRISSPFWKGIGANHFSTPSTTAPKP